jgi:Protein of unknown function (DUF3551)
MERKARTRTIRLAPVFVGYVPGFTFRTSNKYGERTMRAITPSASLLAAGVLAAVLAGSFTASPVSAQSSASYPYCLLTDDAQSCFYTSMAQCMASRRGTADFCEPNNTYAPSRHG